MTEKPPGDDFSVAMALGGLQADVKNLAAIITQSSSANTTALTALAGRVGHVETDVTVLKTDVAVLKTSQPSRLTWPSLIAGGSGLVAVVGGIVALIVMVINT